MSLGDGSASWCLRKRLSHVGPDEHVTDGRKSMSSRQIIKKQVLKQ